MTLRTVIVGAGLAGRWHAHAAQKAGGSLSGIVDPDITRAKELSSQFGNIQTYSSAGEMLAQQKPDVVHICTPTNTHAEVAIQVLDSGISVMLEKPMAETFEDVERLYKLAEERKVQICPMHQFLFQNGVRKIRGEKSRVGEMNQLEVVIRSAGGQGREQADLDSIAFDILPHPLSLFQLFVSDLPDHWSVAWSNPGDIQCISVTHKTRLTLTISMSGRPPICALEVVGTDGTFHADLFHGSAFFEPGTVSRGRKIFRPFTSAARSFVSSGMNLAGRVVRWEPAYPGMVQLVSEFYNSLEGKSKNPITRESALRVARVRDELIKALTSASS